jgi:Fumarase C C-terminus
VTPLSPIIGYDKTSKIAHYAMDNDLTLKEAALKLGFVSEAEFNRVADPRKMVKPSAAITVIFGVVVSISEGLVMFLPDSTFGMGLLGQSGSEAWGKMQYRFNPLWVIQGATEAIQ